MDDFGRTWARVGDVAVMRMTATHLRDGIYLDSSFRSTRRSPKYLFLVGLAWVGIGLSLLMGAAMLLSLAWLLGLLVRAIVRVLQ